jgi:hypothetical protein
MKFAIGSPRVRGFPLCKDHIFPASSARRAEQNSSNASPCRPRVEAWYLFFSRRGNCLTRTVEPKTSCGGNIWQHSKNAAEREHKAILVARTGARRGTPINKRARGHQATVHGPARPSPRSRGIRPTSTQKPTFTVKRVRYQTDNHRFNH